MLLVLLERLGDGGGDGAANLHVGLVEVTAVGGEVSNVYLRILQSCPSGKGCLNMGGVQSGANLKASGVTFVIQGLIHTCSLLMDILNLVSVTYRVKLSAFIRRVDSK